MTEVKEHSGQKKQIINECPGMSESDESWGWNIEKNRHSKWMMLANAREREDAKLVCVCVCVCE